jgi:hypothetical protein
MGRDNERKEQPGREVILDHYDNGGRDEDILSSNIPDDALERAAGTCETAAITMNFCTYNYYQCGPIGGPIGN